MKWSEQELNWIERNQDVLNSGNLEEIPKNLRDLNYIQRLRVLYSLAYLYGLPIAVQDLGYIESIYVLFGTIKVCSGNLGKDDSTPVNIFNSQKSQLELPSTWELKQVDTYSTVKTWKIVDTKGSV